MRIDFNAMGSSDPLDRPFPFGKHAGTLVRDLPHGYVTWFINQYDQGRLTSGPLVDWLGGFGPAGRLRRSSPDAGGGPPDSSHVSVW